MSQRSEFRLVPQSLTPSRAHDAQAGRRLSVCLCLSGQMRSFEDNFGWVAAATEALDLSIVVSTWTERGGKLHGDQKPERLRSVFPYAVTDALPPSWLNLDLLEALPGLRAAALARARDAQVTEPMIHAALPGALIHLEPPLRFAWFEMQRLTSGNPRGSDPFSMQMLYKVWQADLMRRNLEAARGRRFDVVVRARPDRPPRSLDPAFLSRIKPGEIWVQDLYPKRRYIGDMLALGCSRSMDVYGGFFLEAVRRAEADAWTYIHSDLYEYLAGRGLALRGCELMGPFALDRLLDIGDLLEAINLASGDVSRAQDDAIRSHAAAAARSVRLAERLGRGDALLSDASVASELEAVLERFQPARDGGLLHWLAVNAAGALGTDTRLLCASAALTALPEPANPGLAYPLIVNFCIAQEAFTKDKQALFLTGAETLQACLRHPAADPVRGLLQRWLDDAGWRGRVARALDATYEALLREDPGLWMRLAGHAASFGDPALAETVLRRAFERRPDEAQLPQQLAFLLDSLGRAREAAVFAGAAAQAGGDNAHVLHNASIIYLRAGETSESVRLAREAARMEPANAWFHVHLSAALEAAEDFSAAADAAAEAARLAPDDPVIAARRDRLTPPAEKA